MISTLGGLLLIIGAIFTYRGEIFRAVLVYFLADVCWVLISISADQIFGSITVIVGMLLGFGAFLKMQRGTLRKDLKKDKNV